MKHNWMKRIQCWMALLSIAMMQANSTHAIEVAGELYVDLDAANVSGAVWSNAGTLGDFNAVASPTAVNLGGVVPSVIFDGSSAFLSADTAPAGITGLDSTKTIEAWVFNPALAGEETVVSWGHRGGPDGSNLSFNYGSNGAFGAVGHWGGPDLGWNDAGGGPAPLQWHHLAYTFDGTTTRVYSDGVLMNSEDLGAGVINTHAGTQIAIASQFESDGVTLTPGLRGSMAISRVRVHDGVLSDAQIMSNYNEEIGSFPSIYEPPGEPVATPLSSGPIHRYSFSNAAAADAAGATLVDSIGGADGVVRGAGTSLTGTSLKLSGGTSDSAGYGD
ncbi:MAG: LamG domain-containing protein, partial [Planctomycetales bacterium]|nr:LamG domain-containing protein [Planctomycetales bacterium]